MEFPKLFEQRMQLLLQDKFEDFANGYALPLRRGLRINTAKTAENEFIKQFPHPLEKWLSIKYQRWPRLTTVHFKCAFQS